MINLTPFARLFFARRGRRIDDWSRHSAEIQLHQLRWLLFRGAATEFGLRHKFEEIIRASDPIDAFRRNIPLRDYEDFRADVMRMIDGDKSILWPGRTLSFAQSSGTSGGRSKFIPITDDSLRVNHYGGSSDVLAQYLRNFPESRIFAGKAMILGGSFTSELKPRDSHVRIGDLSATLISKIPSGANLFRIPDKQTALLSDWNIKLDRLARAALKADLTNISGVPSWFLRVILRAMELKGAHKASDLWPNLEVFFHGGISFEPYRAEYERLTNPEKMNFFETYNASEGFFATQCERQNNGLLLLIDNGIFYEFIPMGASDSEAVGVEGLKAGKVYELIISSCNGLWRYRIGDTVEVVDTNPVKIRIAGRTKSFINAFGEELMEDNAERAIALACAATNAHISNYTAGPVYAHDREKGFHQWAIEFDRIPDDMNKFALTLDAQLMRLNSDYAAKRDDNLFLNPPEIVSLPEGTFDHWLSRQGNGRLGGQRKIPRLRNDRSILDAIIPQHH